MVEFFNEHLCFLYQGNCGKPSSFRNLHCMFTTQTIGVCNWKSLKKYAVKAYRTMEGFQWELLSEHSVELMEKSKSVERA